MLKFYHIYIYDKKKVKWCIFKKKVGIVSFFLFFVVEGIVSSFTFVSMKRYFYKYFFNYNNKSGK